MVCPEQTENMPLGRLTGIELQKSSKSTLVQCENYKVSSSLSKAETMANRCFKIPQVIVQQGPWDPATIITCYVSLALHLKKGVRKRSGEASAFTDAQES